MIAEKRRICVSINLQKGPGLKPFLAGSGFVGLKPHAPSQRQEHATATTRTCNSNDLDAKVAKLAKFREGGRGDGEMRGSFPFDFAQGQDDNEKQGCQRGRDDNEKRSGPSRLT